MPSVVVDKNGRTTTVHKKPDTASAAKKLLGFIPVGNGAPSRSSLIDSIMVQAQSLSSYDASMYKSSFKAIKTEHLPAVLEVLKHNDAELDDIASFSNRHEASKSKELYNEWVGEYLSRYWEMKEWPSGYEGHGVSPEATAKLVTENLYLRSVGVTEEVAESILRLSFSLQGTGISGGIHLRTTPYGVSMFLPNPFLREFAEKHNTPEEVERACALISSHKLNRLEDLTEVFDEDIPVSIAEGIL